MTRNARQPEPSIRRLRPVSAVILLLFAAPGSYGAVAIASAAPREVEFNESFLQRGGRSIDISRFNKGSAALPGDYRVGLYVNEVWQGQGRVSLRDIEAGSGNVQPCFDRDLLARIGVDLVKLSPEAVAWLDAGAGACLTLSELVPDAIATFDVGEQRLDISLPQAMLNKQARGYVDPKYWDDGVPAAMLRYNANVFRSESGSTSSTQSYLGVNAGLNAGPWRLRYSGNLTHNDETGTRYQNLQTYLQRSIEPIKSQLTLGDAYTDGNVFDSFGLRGAMLASDDRMYPESMRGYAPTVRGIASTNAKVQVRQNGNIIYETNVAPGAFEINDLYPTGYGGNLDVIVTEADGSVHVSTVPYAAPVNALRPGMNKYSFGIGQYRDDGIHLKPFVSQAAFQSGISNLLTVYGGAIFANSYLSGALGVALNTDYGAFGFDATLAKAGFDSLPDRDGQSFRLSYTKQFAPTNTNIALAAYRYSTSGFLSLGDAMRLRDLDDRGLAASMPGTQRGRLQATINQALGERYGSLYLSGSVQDYWNRSGTDTQYSAGYNNSYRRINYGLSANRQYDVNTGKWDNRFMLNIGIPLGSGAQVPYSMTTYQHDSRDGSNSIQESISGAIGADGALTYGLNAGRSTGNGGSNSVGANVGYAAPFASLSASASRSNSYTQTGAGLSGGIVAYPGGIAFTPNLSDTIAIVEADGAGGARVTNASGLRIDAWGHAVVSGLRPFERNDIEIDPKGLPMSVQLKSTQQAAAPTAGAVVRVRFETESGGRAVVLRAHLGDGKPLPFGAEVFDGEGHSVGVVAQASRIVAHKIGADTGELTVKWGGGQQCKLGYQLPTTLDGKAAPYYLTDSACI
ncbi:fimbria/pilus outer membrane usher protein [Jeongeupia sp. USM3]|uniref:fimbria/pilus outer membrane usher protein n=1 Tax=Jeongeupia sp. USM3 TaxID=1906741 RepID=UPI00089E02D5|nr:fimbria/pilus outer membrane usher protein [Jeongeupia sp. USM3]AOX99060.1 fimbrial assembly protein [Jeongeupia sp. USM3]